MYSDEDTGKRAYRMKRKAGKAGIALIFGALSAIFGVVIGSTLKDQTLDIKKIRKDGYTENNKSA